LRATLGLTIAGLLAASPPAARSQSSARQRPRPQAPATRAVYLDNQGVVRWSDDKQEVTLFGANYVLPTASDYRAAGYLHGDHRGKTSPHLRTPG